MLFKLFKKKEVKKKTFYDYHEEMVQDVSLPKVGENDTIETAHKFEGKNYKVETIITSLEK